ncbi:hypothetical protein G6F65_022585 [Rhizopus arrhizus]|nr:hypothetical protein G6F65_022585 [Rhizopus arrhizus]
MLPRVPLWRSLTRWFLRAEVRQGLDALAQVGIDDYAFQRASTLSGGQQQRAAIARTLVQNARVILADEPIASLDPESGGGGVAAPGRRGAALFPPRGGAAPPPGGR